MKNLDEVIKAIKVDDVDIFIGASSGWLFIGNKMQYENEIDALSEAIYEKHEKRYNSYTNRLQMVLKEPKKTYAIHINGGTYYRSYKSYVKSLSRMMKLYEGIYLNYVPLRQRNVLDIYMKDAEEGVAIIIEGQENGPYWTKGEQNEKRILRDTTSAIV